MGIYSWSDVTKETNRNIYVDTVKKYIHLRKQYALIMNYIIDSIEPSSHQIMSLSIVTTTTTNEQLTVAQFNERVKFIDPQWMLSQAAQAHYHVDKQGRKHFKQCINCLADRDDSTPIQLRGETMHWFCEKCIPMWTLLMVVHKQYAIYDWYNQHKEGLFVITEKTSGSPI
jgi:hypothetical protein